MYYSCVCVAKNETMYIAKLALIDLIDYAEIWWFVFHKN